MDRLCPPPTDLGPLKTRIFYPENDSATNRSSNSHIHYDDACDTSCSSRSQNLKYCPGYISFTHSQALTAVSDSISNTRGQSRDGDDHRAAPSGRVDSWLLSCRKVDHTGGSGKGEVQIDKPIGGHIELGQVIREAMILAAQPSSEVFLPCNELHAIITKDSFISELERTTSYPTNSSTITDYAAIAQQVLGPHGHEGTWRKAIFAILCLLDLALQIVDFIEEELLDEHMPFSIDSNKLFCRRGDANQPINLFKHWNHRNREFFQRYQEKVKVQFLKFAKGTNPKILRLNLGSLTLLPYVKDEAAEQVRLKGGFSIVRKFRIHDAHHDLDKSPLYVASKELLFIDISHDYHEDYPNTEVDAYRCLNYKQHPHIIQLLAICRQSGKLHFIFPWAEGNLYDFWCTHFSRTTDIPRGVGLSQWMSRELYGLASALGSIHHPDVDEANVERLSSHDQSKRHGRHGDMKPQNILWFKECTDSTAPGTLKISDLGSAEFHSQSSKSVRLSDIHGFTNTYRAPKFDLEASISPRYDIWSLGCIMMEFVIWYLDGGAGVENFRAKRLPESSFIIRFDGFYNIALNENKVTTRTKPSVIEELDRLGRHQDSSEFIVDLLSLIQSDLLRLRSTKRASSDQIAGRLRETSERCEKDPAYCTERSFRTIRRASKDLSESIELYLSSRMQDEYKATFREVNLFHETPQSVRQKRDRVSGAILSKEVSHGEQGPSIMRSSYAFRTRLGDQKLKFSKARQS